MKKLVFLTSIIAAILIMQCLSLATEEATWQEENGIAVASSEETARDVVQEDVPETKQEEDHSEELTGASEQVIGTLTKKEKRINELTEKFNDKTLGTIAYWLEVARFYSTPIFFIFLTIGAFNFFIVGNKKLDKKEQGFGWMTACVIGWVVFQCIPLIFTLVTLGFAG